MSQSVPAPRVENGRVWCPLLNDWRADTPEENVRQGFIEHLHTAYGYAYEQMAQEQRVQFGHHSPRADVVVWETVAARAAGVSPVLVVECKAESLNIHPKDYYQGESYARAIGEPCEFVVMHNRRETAFFRIVRGLRGSIEGLTDIPKASDWADAKRIEELRAKTRAFSRKEFQGLLFDCHSILRDVHKMEPGRAFDTISKVLFVKMYVERTGAHGTFSTAFLKKRAEYVRSRDKAAHEILFEETKDHYEADGLFTADDTLNDISKTTFERLVQKLETLNLSATGDDVKGLAFEEFLGRTFRGEMGQFFTPRPIVDFAVAVLDPREDDLVCDPAAGSGGFLIRAFEHVRAAIVADVDARKDEAREEIEALGLPADEEEVRIDAAFAALNEEIDPERAGSRVYRLSREAIFGTDAEPRAARTAKMNMIMHGDGHGGIHYHDGLLDVNGIFEGRFDVVLTNPPFGSTVNRDQRVGTTEQTRVLEDPAAIRDYRRRYGAAWEASHARLTAAAIETRGKEKEPVRGTPVLDLFEIGKDKDGRATEVLFLERCLRLLKPGGRMGIVLPDGNLNNPSLGWLRRWAEGRARLLAVVSLPEETFRDASVKASLLFVQRFTATDEADWAGAWATARAALDAEFDAQRDALVAEAGPGIVTGGDDALGHVLADLDRLGAGRSGVGWALRPPPPYPEGVMHTRIVNPTWATLPTGKAHAETRKAAADLRAAFNSGWTEAHTARARALSSALGKTLRRVDAAHTAALWAHVREAFDYPVFTAAPARVGVTSTGSDGPSDLPEVLADYRAFAAWVEAGAAEADEPVFSA